MSFDTDDSSDRSAGATEPGGYGSESSSGDGGADGAADGGGDGGAGSVTAARTVRPVTAARTVRLTVVAMAAPVSVTAARTVAPMRWWCRWRADAGAGSTTDSGGASSY